MVKRESFGSRAAVIMALAGTAIGLGNFWRFPYMVGEYGGAAFIIVYILCAFLMSLPIFFAESVIGRRTRANAIGAMQALAPHSFWQVLGWLSVITPTIIVSYYSIVGGWSVEYFCKSFGMNYGTFDPDGWKALFFDVIFLGLSCAIVALGVKSGIEKFSKFSIPTLFVLIVVIAIYSLNMPGSGAGVQYLVKPDFSKLTGRSFAAALGQSFYSLSLGMGIIITYSSYISKDENIVSSGVGTAIADTLFAILAGFAIMPAVFAAGIAPSAGPGLIFETLPHVFVTMTPNAPWISAIISALFFLSVIVAAMTSSVSLIEVGAAYLIEERHMKRGVASLVMFFLVLALGLVSVFSIKVFGAVDALSSDVLLTFGALLAVLFVGWKMKKDDVKDELTNGDTCNHKSFKLIYFLIRFVAPIAIIIIFLSNFF
jgi:NSS family neurotransmitter:Na+ symporter